LSDFFFILRSAASTTLQQTSHPATSGVTAFNTNRDMCTPSLQCFDTVGWATGRASGLYKLDAGLLVVMI